MKPYKDQQKSIDEIFEEFHNKDRKCFSAELKFNNIRYRKSGFLNEESANEYLTNLKKQLCL